MPSADCQLNKTDPAANRQPAIGNWQSLAWQGWQFRVPADWNPVKVEGDADQGLLLLADLERPRLGLRWRKLSPRVDAEAWSARSVKEEVGALAAKESKPFSSGEDWKGGRLYTEPEAPGRDVWAAVSAATGRGLQAVYHAKQRDRVFAGDLVPGFCDTAPDASRLWAIFDLTCTTPPGWTLQWYRFHAGDLSLAFKKGRSNVALRQIGPAGLALSRQPLGTWIKQQDKSTTKLYRPVVTPTETQLILRTQPLAGLAAEMPKRRRLFWAVRTRDQKRYAVHDESRNRLVVVQSDDDAAARALLATVGGGAA